MTDFQTIKYRLVGAAVVVSSLVLTWWLFFDHDIRRHQHGDRTLPEPLVIERFNIEKPKMPEQPKPVAEPLVPTDSRLPEIDEKPITEAADEKKAIAQSKGTYSAIDEQGMPEAWVLQVASFQNRDNARQLQQRLLDADMPAYIKAFHLPEGTSHRVLLGPKLSKPMAEKLQQQIEKEFAMQSLLMRYKPGFEE